MVKYFVELSEAAKARQEKRTESLEVVTAATVADLSYCISLPVGRGPDNFVCSVPKVWAFLVVKAAELRRQQHVNIGKVIAHSRFPDCSSSSIGPTCVFFQIYVFKIFIKTFHLTAAVVCIGKREVIKRESSLNCVKSH